MVYYATRYRKKNQLHIACAVLESKSNHYYYYCLWYKTNTYSSDVSFSLQ